MSIQICKWQYVDAQSDSIELSSTRPISKPLMYVQMSKATNQRRNDVEKEEGKNVLHIDRMKKKLVYIHWLDQWSRQ